jgi:hypothetical protein
MGGFWAHQTELSRSGGCWSAASNGIGLSLVKSLKTYACWTRATIGSSQVHILNCYVEPGDSQTVKNRALRIAEIAGDIMKQDKNA